jgi:hypothetical protein|tara:strand:+ start:10347 stop:10859 length:513 start_codon:yes stop_codon:yes gene_type:complete
MENNDSFKLNPSSDNIVELAFDEPKSGTNNFGRWFLYGVNKEGRETSFFTNSASLHKKLGEYGKGAKLNIKKEEYAPGKYAWEVHALEGTVPSKSQEKTLDSSPVLDARTLDIHKQVCLKLAVQSLEHLEFDIKAVEERTYQLLDVLHGSRPNNIAEKVKEVFDTKEMPF